MATSHNFTGPLSKFVNRIINNRRLSAEVETNLYDYAEDFLRDLNNDTFPTIKEFRIDPKNIVNNVVNFPADMIGWGKIAYESGTQVVPLGNNDNLAFNNRIEITPSPNQIDDVFFPDGFYQLFYPRGIPRTPVPAFRINFKDKKIYIDPQVNIPNFYMEYLSDCLDITKGLLIHPFYQTGLLLHLEFWLCMHTPSMKSDTPMLKDLLDSETEKYRSRTAPSSMDILTDFKRVFY
jgi:hypothetical protein